MTDDELFTKAYELIAKQECDEAFRICIQLDDKGYVPVKHVLGWLYEQGLGAPKDERMSFQYYLSAAKHGDCVSQHGVGNCYQVGLGVEKDYAQAYYWYSRSIECAKHRPEQECGANWDRIKLKKLMTSEQLNEANKILKP
jgi:TPR repeat protein